MLYQLKVCDILIMLFLTLLNGPLVKWLTHSPLKATFMGSNPIQVTNLICTQIFGLKYKNYSQNEFESSFILAIY